MSALALLETARASGVTLSADGDRIIATPSSALTAVLREAIKANKTALLQALSNEASDRDDSASGQPTDAEQRVLAKLDGNPELRYALETDDEARGDEVLVTLAVRDIGTCELAIPRENYDAFEVMRLIDENTQPESRSPT